MKTLLQICEERYFPVRVTIRAETTRYQYRLALRSFAEFLGREPTLADLEDDTVSAWLCRLMDQQPPASISTIREKVRRITTLWTWLARKRLVEQFPTIQNPTAPDPMPEALTVDQLCRLFISAAKERGLIGGVPAGLWWQSFLSFVWNTAERKSAALAVRVEWLDLPAAIVKIPPHVRKGKKKWGVYQLWPETVPLLQETIDAAPGRELVWPWDRCKESYYTDYDRILRGAGIPVNRKTKTHGLRVSHATWKTVAGGDATKALMHSDPATTRKFYIDSTKLPRDDSRLFVPWQAAAGPAAAGEVAATMVQRAAVEAAEAAGGLEIDPALAWL